MTIKTCKLTINTTRSDSPTVLNLVNGEVDITIGDDNSVEIRVSDDNGGLFWKIGTPVKKDPPRYGLTRSAQELLEICKSMSGLAEYAYVVDGWVGVRRRDLERAYNKKANSAETPFLRSFHDLLEELKVKDLVNDVVSRGGLVVTLNQPGESS